METELCERKLVYYGVIKNMDLPYRSKGGNARGGVGLQ